MKNTKISVIIPTYNYAQYILEALKSIENQNYPKELIEVIIIDDGSTDSTPKLFENYKGTLNLTYHYQQNKGKANATQKGISLCKGEIIFNLDADDFFYPEKILTIVTIFDKYPELTHVGHAAETIENGLITKKELIPPNISNQIVNGNELLEEFLSTKLLFGGGSTFSARSYKLKSVFMIGDVDMYIDEYLIYAACLNGKSYLIDQPLSVWRNHGHNFSFTNRGKKRDKSFRLSTSSVAMLSFINKNNFNKKIIDLYYLKHLDRHINHLESYERKEFKHMIEVLKVIFSFKYTFNELLTYRIFSRLLPTIILIKLKSIRDKNV
ncbi:hypothetical protein A5893_14380 [Pedobacter psychrophilus]|uniref:Glycosyltransferase 2-like domain-containing protein n=1 Tax=Pedobacter psychrophilus TaxID=1826909 RepID=A0A179DC23_9SPHI|nr:glycosyltransferase family A protein [Pedobacter psychrophilus]OAQ38596.1 hypothetical protein A5893_14380 [Pedobacter psychrophilus]